MIEKKSVPFLLIERKLVACSATWLLTLIVFALIGAAIKSPSYILYAPIFLGFYSGAALLFAGIPVSLLSDWVSKKLPFRPLWAFIIHVGGGALVMNDLLGEGDGGGDNRLNIFAVMLGAAFAAVFWLVDEWYRRRLRKKAE
ncbi:hypothetical protein [Planifilum fimeticola]